MSDQTNIILVTLLWGALKSVAALDIMSNFWSKKRVSKNNGTKIPQWERVFLHYWFKIVIMGFTKRTSAAVCENNNIKQMQKKQYYRFSYYRTKLYL
jgi:hypothetical protein